MCDVSAATGNVPATIGSALPVAEHPADLQYLYPCLPIQEGVPKYMKMRKQKEAEAAAMRQLREKMQKMRGEHEQAWADEWWNLAGLCYEYGKGVEADQLEAVKWYRKAAEQGDITAQFHLGLCYEYGKGVEADQSEAVNWFQKAADMHKR